MEASAQQAGGYLSLARLSVAEGAGIVAAPVLGLSLFVAMTVCGFIRQAAYVDAKKPPGVT